MRRSSVSLLSAVVLCLACGGVGSPAQQVAATPTPVCSVYDNSASPQANATRIRSGGKALSDCDHYLLDELPASRDADLIFYGTNTHWSDPERAADRALRAGYKRIRVLEGADVGPNKVPETRDRASSTPPEASLPEGSGLLPLAVGNAWHYSISRHTGGGPRFLLVFGESARTDKIADWTFEITGKEGDKYTAVFTKDDVGSAPSTTKLTLWEQDGVVWMQAGRNKQPAIEAVLPPHPVSSEQIPCVAHILGNMVGRCAPVYGGPLGTTPGIRGGYVGGHIKENAALGQVLVGILTAGTFIPGNKSTSEDAELTRFVPGPGQAVLYQPSQSGLVREVQQTHGTSGFADYARAHPSDVESIAAAVSLLSDESIDFALDATLGQLTIPNRYPVLRVAIAHSDNKIHTLARAALQLDPSVPKAELSALMPLFPSDPELVRKILSGEYPLTVMVLGDTEGSSDHNILDALSRNLSHFTPEIKDATLLLEQFHQDAERHEALRQLIKGVPERQRADVLFQWIPLFDFDEHKLFVIEEHRALLRSLSSKQRRALVKLLRFQQDEATAMLFAPEGAWESKRFEPSGKPSLYTLVHRLNTTGTGKQEFIRREISSHVLTVPIGEAVLGDISFDTDRAEIFPVLLEALPEKDRGKAMVNWLPKIEEGAGQVEILESNRSWLRGLPRPQLDQIVSVVDRSVRSDVRSMLLGAEGSWESIRVDAQGQPTVFVAVSKATFDGDRLNLLEKELASKPITVKMGAAVLKSFSFDDKRLRAVDQILPKLKEGERSEAILEYVSLFSFDGEKLTLLETHQHEVLSLSVAQRQAILRHISFEKSKARKILGL